MSPIDAGYTAEQLNNQLDEFERNYDDILPMIRKFNEKLEAFRVGERDGDETPLAEAVWMAEADLNYWRGNAKVLLDTAIRDSTFFLLPVTEEEGELYVFVQDLLEAQQQLLDSIAVDTLERPIQYLDLSIKDLGLESVTVRVVVARRFEQQDVPSRPIGCFDMAVNNNGPYPASDIMNQWLICDEWEHTGQGAYIQPSFYTGISSPLELTTLNWYANYQGYTVYLGSIEQNNGPALLANGQGYTEVCFPDYWGKYLDLQTWYMDQFAYSPGRVLINREYETTYGPRIGGPLDFGSLWYPMGPFDHSFTFQRATWVRM